MEHRVSHLGAIGLALAGFTFWVLADTSMKLAGNSRLPAYEIVACLGLAIVVVLVARGFCKGRHEGCCRRARHGNLCARVWILGTICVWWWRCAICR